MTRYPPEEKTPQIHWVKLRRMRTKVGKNDKIGPQYGQDHTGGRLGNKKHERSVKVEGGPQMMPMSNKDYSPTMPRQLQQKSAKMEKESGLRSKDLIINKL